MPSTQAVAIGVHPIHFSREFLREVMLRWNGPGTEYASEDELQDACDSHEDQIRQTMSQLHLIELRIDLAPPGFRLDGISQDESQAEHSQVPWDEHWLSADGRACVATGMDGCPSIRPVGVAFFMHHFQSGAPLHGPWGAMVLPPPTPIPERLRRMVPYDPPT